MIMGDITGRGLAQGDLDWPDIDVGSSGFFAVSLSFRPATGADRTR